MRKRLSETVRAFALDTSAAEIAEAAAVLPLLFMVLFGIFWFGQAFRIYGTLTHAAREGARAAAAPVCSTCAAVDPSDQAWNTVQNVLQAGALDFNKLRPPTKTPGVCNCSSTATTTTCAAGTVPCDAKYRTNICIQGVTHSGPKNRDLDQVNIQLSASASSNNPGAGVCGISVSFQYPYQFWLPFTSLNLQTLNLQAQAQARVESQ